MNKTGGFIRTFSILGQFLGQFTGQRKKDQSVPEELNRQLFRSFTDSIANEHIHNPWFTPDNVELALSGISSMLKEEVLTQWLEPYKTRLDHAKGNKTVGLVLAGNIPLVGFHDILCVLAAGHRILAKPSSKDERLIRLVAESIQLINPGLGSRIEFTEDRLRAMDAVIATGSDNSARYFEYYFRDIPHIIRKNRNGVAVLTGKETGNQLRALGSDIFSYFGLGCRNVTKLYIPESYDLTILLNVLDDFASLSQHHKYANNVEYYRSIFLMNRIPFLDNGFLILKEDNAIASPVGVVYYERYSELDHAVQQLADRKQEIQCIVSVLPVSEGSVFPGTSQEPMPWDYADGVDTLDFLTELG